MKYFLVPERDIKRLEKSRVALWGMVDKLEGVKTLSVHFFLLNEVSPAMYEITHRRYPVYGFKLIFNSIIKFVWRKGRNNA